GARARAPGVRAATADHSSRGRNAMNTAVLEQDLLKKSTEAAALLEKTAKACQAHEEKDKDGKVIATGRLMTDDEKKAIQKLIDEGNAIKATLGRAKGDANLTAEIERLTQGLNPAPRTPDGVLRPVYKSLGQQWGESESGLFFLKGAHKGRRNWDSPVAELGLPDMQATTLDESSGSGGKLVVTQYQPGIQPLLFKKLTIRDLLAPGTTDSSSVTYMKETTF